jgi:hypothetical protein
MALIEWFPTPTSITALDREAFSAAAWPLIGRKVSKARLINDIYETACASVALSVSEESAAITMFRMVIAQSRNLCAASRQGAKQMAYYIGFVLVGVLAIMVSGHMAGWLIRKLTGVTKVQSYKIAVPIMTVVGGWSVTYQGIGSASFLANWLTYAISGVIALPILIARERKAEPEAVSG